MKNALKTTLIFLAVLTSTCSVFAQEQKADWTTLSMVNTVTESCPNEFAKTIAHQEVILNLEESKTVNEKGQTVYISKMSTGSRGFFMRPAEVLTRLTLIRTPYEVQPADAFLFNAECKVEEVK